MGSGILLGIFWHFVGAASAACFYAPLKKVKNWYFFVDYFTLDHQLYFTS